MKQLSGINSSFKQHIIKSWEQCTSLAIDPELKKAPKITEEDFSLICQKRKHLLLNISQPIISKFGPFFDYSEYAVALTDEHGIILSIKGNDKFFKEVSALGFDVGANWSEKSVGTNAIGNCLALGQPICIVGEDHFVKQWRNFGCAASPIRDPFSGEIIGSLDLSCRADAFHIFSLGFVESLAMILETTLCNMSNTRDYNKHNLIIEQFLEASKEADMRDGMIAIDVDGNILASNKILHSILAAESGTPLKNIFQLRPKLRETLYQSNVTAVSYTTKIEEYINDDRTYLVNFLPIFNKDRIHEGWIGRLLKISSGDKALGNMAATGIKENYIQPIYISSAMSEIRFIRFLRT